MTTKKTATVTNGLADDVPDGEVVYIESPVAPEDGGPTAVGKCTAFQFRNLWALKGWKVSTEEAYLLHQQRLAIQSMSADQQALIGEPEAQDIILNEIGAI
jgi:antibiotic biosynthesis monooxygenase (ABM) superfamily enzyme